jgi:hypothetical protein
MYNFDFDSIWVNRAGTKRRLHELTQEEFAGIELPGIMPKYTLINSCAGAEILRDTVKFPWFNSYNSARSWIEKTYKSMIAQAKREGL